MDARYIVVLDCETTGFPSMKGHDEYYLYTNINKYNSSRVIQIAAVKYDFTGNVIKKINHLIKPNDFIINNASIHGITTKRALKDGISFSSAIDDFENLISNCCLLVSHNINFDKNVLLSECHRQGKNSFIDKFDEINTFCTSQNCTHITKITMPFLPEGQYKYPKLQELHQVLFGKKFTGAHDALNDTEACGKCFFEMLKRNLFVIKG